MPADFMEELNKEKQNLLNSENSSGINEQIASSLQNVIDKANASSESYEILERVVNSFNHAGKNLRDNIGEIISTFNALNNSVKTNTSSASSLKKVYSENFFSGTVRGADNLINKLNEIQENISSIKSFGNIFEESVIGGNNLLNTINEIKSSLAEISSFNISSDVKIGNLPRFQSGGMVTGGSKTGDKILARLNAGEWVLTEQQMNNVAKMLSHNSGKNYTADQIFSMTGGKKGIDYDNSGIPMFANGGKASVNKKDLFGNDSNSKLFVGLKKYLKELIKEYEKNDKKIDELDQIHSNVNVNISDLQKSGEKIKKSIDSENSNFGKKVEEFNKKINELEEDASIKISEGTRIIEEALKSGNFSIEEFHIEDEELKKYISDLFESVQLKIKDKVESYKKEILKNDEDIKTVKNKESEIKENISLNEGLLDEYNQIIDKLNKKINDIQSKKENTLKKKEEKERKGKDTTYEDSLISKLDNEIAGEENKKNETIEKIKEVVETIKEYRDEFSANVYQEGGLLRSKHFNMNSKMDFEGNRDNKYYHEFGTQLEDSLRQFITERKNDAKNEANSQYTSDLKEHNEKIQEYYENISIVDESINSLSEEIKKTEDEIRILSDVANSIKYDYENSKPLKDDFNNFNKKTQAAIKKEMANFSVELGKKLNTKDANKIFNSNEFVIKLSDLISDAKKSFQKTGSDEIDRRKKVLSLQGNKNGKEYELLIAIKKLGLEGKVGELKEQNGNVDFDDIKKIFLKYYNTIEGAIKVKEEKIDVNKILTGTSKLSKNITTFGTLIQDTTRKLANFANQLNEFGLKYANLRVELSRQSTSGSDILAGQTVQGWADKFDLTREQSSQLFPVIEEFIRNSNVNMSSIDTIAENLKQSTGVLKPEDLKQALTALQGMTQGQVNYMLGQVASTSDRYGSAFSLLENPSQLDAVIKAQASGAFTGETPEGLEDGDKALLRNNQKLLSIVGEIKTSLSKVISDYLPSIPYLSKIFSTLSQMATFLLLGKGLGFDLLGGGKNSKAMRWLRIGRAVVGRTKIGRGVFRAIGKLTNFIKNIPQKGVSSFSGLGKFIGGKSGMLLKLGKVGGGITAAGLSTIGGFYENSKRNEIINNEEKELNKKGFLTTGEIKYLKRKKERSNQYFWQDMLKSGVVGAATFAGGAVAGVGAEYAMTKLFDYFREKDAKENEKLKNGSLTKEEIKALENNAKVSLDSLRSLKTYQTFIKQIKSGQYTKFEDYMTRFSDANLKSLSMQGGTNAAFKIFSGNKAEFATASLGKSMKLINEQIRNVTKGLNAMGTRSISGVEQIAAYTGLIEQQISITEKWISSIESSIGRYSEIPSIILNEMKNKISQFSFGTYAIGGGTVSGGREQISSIISRTNSNIEVAFDQFSSDLQKVSEADAVYKNLQQQKLNNANSVLGTNYSMEDLKDSNTVDQITREAKNLDFNIMSQLDKKGISSSDYEAYQNYQMISTFDGKKIKDEKSQKQAKDMFEKLAGYVESSGSNNQRIIIKNLQENIDKEGGISKENWKTISGLSDRVYQKNNDRFIKEKASDAMFAQNIDKWQKETLAIKELLSVNNGDNLRTRNELKMIEGLNKIFQEIRNSTRQLIEASINNSNSVFQRNVAQIESLKIGSAKWSSEGIGGNVVRMSNAKTEEIASSAENLRKTRDQMMKEYSKSYSKDLRNIFKNGNAGMSDSDQIELQKYGKKLNERDVLRSKIQSGIATKEERKQEARLSLELEKDSVNLSERAKAKGKGSIELAKNALERSSSERANAIVEVSKKLEEVKASFIPEFLKTIEHLSNIETFTSLTYRTLSNANKAGMKYLGTMGASREEIMTSGNAAIESSIKSGDDSVKKAQNTFAQLTSEKGAEEQIKENFRKIKQKDPNMSDKNAMKFAQEQYVLMVSKAGEQAAGGAKMEAMSKNDQTIRDMEQALNALSTKRQEGLNIEKAMATMVGAPLQEILRIEKESIKETFLQYKNAESRYKTTLEAYNKGAVSQEALLESQNNMKKMQQKAYSEILGAQRSVMEQMFGRLVGTFKGQAGFAGASMYSKYGAGLSVNAQGVVTGMGKENLNARGSYGERILGNQLSALGGGKQVSSEKDEKTVEAIKQMANIHKTTNDLVSKILEKMNKEKTEAESKNEKAKNEAEAQKNKDAVTKEFLKGQFDRIPGINGKNEKEIQKEQPKAMKYDQDIKDKNQQVKAELKREYKGGTLTSEVRDKSKNIDELRGEQLLRKKGIIDPNYYKNLFNKYDSDPELMKKKHEDINIHAIGCSISISNHNDRKAQKAFQYIRSLTPEQVMEINENYMSSKNQTVVPPVQRSVTSNSSQQNNLNNKIASNNTQNQKVEVTLKIDASDKMKEIAKIEPKNIVTKSNIVQANQQANMRQIGQA